MIEWTDICWREEEGGKEWMELIIISSTVVIGS
jgi:hypothetical protein